ncbi:hypothetical protein BC826DRAFT_24452 [Russula brevipes]|nr:hypothetical protein BC826DRAFT_24452 [Russula brevipes]
MHRRYQGPEALTLMPPIWTSRRAKRRCGSGDRPPTQVLRRKHRWVIVHRMSQTRNLGLRRQRQANDTRSSWLADAAAG